MTKYNTVAEAYGFWKNSSVAVMEARAKAIEKDIAEDPNADVAAYAIEAEAFYGVPVALRVECKKRITPEMRTVLDRFDAARGQIPQPRT